MCKTNIEQIASYMVKYKLEIVVIDSIQTIYNPEIQSMVSGVSQEENQVLISHKLPNNMR